MPHPSVLTQRLFHTRNSILVSFSSIPPEHSVQLIFSPALTTSVLPYFWNMLELFTVALAALYKTVHFYIQLLLLHYLYSEPSQWGSSCSLPLLTLLTLQDAAAVVSSPLKHPPKTPLPITVPLITQLISDASFYLMKSSCEPVSTQLWEESCVHTLVIFLLIVTQTPV